MLNCDRERRTKQELDAGLREKLMEARKLRFHADKLFDEIEEIVCKKGLDRIFIYNSTPAYRENPLI